MQSVLALLTPRSWLVHDFVFPDPGNPGGFPLGRGPGFLHGTPQAGPDLDLTHCGQPATRAQAETRQHRGLLVAGWGGGGRRASRRGREAARNRVRRRGEAGEGVG
jgi:hypothetical protein